MTSGNRVRSRFSGRHHHVHSGGQIVKKAVYIAIGIDLDGKKDVLVIMPAMLRIEWSRFFSLKISQ